MSQDVFGATFAIALGSVVGLTHLIAARDPERNAITRFMRDYYENTWPLLGSLPSRQAMLWVSIGGFLVALAAAAGLIYALTR